MVFTQAMGGDPKYLAVLDSLDKVRDGILCGDISHNVPGLRECLDRVLRTSGSFQSPDMRVPPLRESFDQVIRERILATLPITNGHRGRAAGLLKISRRTMSSQIKRLGIRFPRFRSKHPR